ncbi:hypothetical protein [Trichlorobacter lovleyi]
MSLIKPQPVVTKPDTATITAGKCTDVVERAKGRIIKIDLQVILRR